MSLLDQCVDDRFRVFAIHLGEHHEACLPLNEGRYLAVVAAEHQVAFPVPWHGTIFSGRTKYDKGFYTGRRIRKVGQKELNADWGIYTSCDEEEPHYSFRARRMKL